MKGFSPKWCRRVESIVTGGSVGIKINDEVGPYFQTRCGLRQGDPMSPILFNIIADMLALLINRAKADGQIRGVLPISLMMVYQFYNMQMTPLSL
jgi:hypothetical protein